MLGTAWAGNPPRVVSLAPALTETMCYLGGGKYLAGRCSACDYPAGIKTLPVAGKFGMPEIEKIVALKPDWVIGNSFANASAVKKLRQLGIETTLAQISTPEDYIAWLKIIGKKLNLQAQAKAAEQAFRNDEKFLQTLEPLNLKVLWVVNAKPLIVCGKGSLPDSVLKMVKVENAAGSVDKEYFRCSAEWLSTAKIDMIIWSVPGTPAKNGGFLKKIPAVKNNKVIHLAMDDPICRPGPRFMQSVKALRKKLEGAAWGREKKLFRKGSFSSVPTCPAIAFGGGGTPSLFSKPFLCIYLFALQKDKCLKG